ncbi:MAG: glycosyltransferase [Anaerolineales bacterium]|nr:glycosyltransferase [Anaerolineales bacterium]
MVIGLLLIYWVHNQYYIEVVVTPLSSFEGRQYPFISVIVPARNEENNIRRCVKALLNQDYPNFEVIVVEDRSTDRTPQILAQLQAEERKGRLLVIRGEELPPGWAGKPHALVQGATAARGDWLCFVDADTFASPSLLVSTLESAWSTGADLFTMLTYQELASFWEKAVLPLIFTGLSVGFPARRVNNPELSDAIASGQFILVRRDVYEATGGHASVRERIDEDKALAELIKGSGYRLVLADGRAVARTQMYTNLGGIWEGFTKNIYLGLRDRLGLLLFGAIVGLFGALALPFWLVAGLFWWGAEGGLQPGIVSAQAVVLWVYLLFVRARQAIALEISPWYALTLPLGALIFTAMMFTSTVNVLSGRGVRWKERVYYQKD